MDSLLSKSLTEFSKNWLSYRDFCLGESKTGYKLRKVNKNHKIYDLFIKDIRSQISNFIPEKYTVDSSLGDGNLAAVPWIAIFDKSITNSVRKGFYVVMLFSQSAEKLYIAIGLGSGQFEDRYKRTKKCLDVINNSKIKFQNLFDQYAPENSSKENIDLISNSHNLDIKGSSKFLVNSYEMGVPFNKVLNFEDQSELRIELLNFINSYQLIIEDQQSENLDFLVDSYIPIKKSKNLNYEIPEFKPRVKKIKFKNNQSTIFKSKNKRRTQESKKIGTAGEEHVYDYEYQKLKSLGREDLAKKIRKHYALYEYPGWDLTSYNEKGEEIFIEVKSTKGKVINSLEITDTEWKAAIDNKEKYFIYLVNRALDDDIMIIDRIKNPALLVDKNIITIETSVYHLELYKS